LWHEGLNDQNLAVLRHGVTWPPDPYGPLRVHELGPDLSPPGYPLPLNDHRPILAATNFGVETYEDQPQAEILRRRFYERLVAAKSSLERESGDQDAAKLLFQAEATSAGSTG
jgi:hypothetical protein